MKQYKYRIDGTQYDVTIEEIKGQNAKLLVNGVHFDVQMLGNTITEDDLPEVVATTDAAPAAAPTPATPAPAAAPAAGTAGAGKPIKAPLPGVILGVKVAQGDTVKKGQTLLVLEAMKMENNINAEADGTVTGVCVKQGDSVMEGTVLITVA